MTVIVYCLVPLPGSHINIPLDISKGMSKVKVQVQKVFKFKWHSLGNLSKKRLCCKDAVAQRCSVKKVFLEVS